jgi:hypothetical protein
LQELDGGAGCETMLLLLEHIDAAEPMVPARGRGLALPVAEGSLVQSTERSLEFPMEGSKGDLPGRGLDHPQKLRPKKNLQPHV